MRTIFIVSKGTTLIDVFIFHSLWRDRQGQIEGILKAKGFTVTILEKDRTLLEEVEEELRKVRNK